MPRAEDSVVIRNVYYMMAYAFKAIQIREYADLGQEDFEGVDDLLAAILSLGLDAQRKRGLERGYSEIEEDVSGVRGRIDASGTFRHQLQRRPLARCSFDEYSEDTYKNRILKAAAKVLISSPDVAAERRRSLKRSLIFLRDVADVEPRDIRWDKLSYHRNNGSYQMLMNVCYLVLRDMLPSKEGERARLARFIDDQALHALYEKFVLEYFARHHPHLGARAKILDSALSDGAPSFVPRLHTDITLTTPERTLIIDAKCYGRILHCRYDREILTPANYHQIFTYVATEAYNTPEKKVEGMLLYALTESEAAISKQWEQAGHSFHCRTLDLSQNFEGIRKQLDGIAGLFDESSCLPYC